MGEEEQKRKGPPERRNAPAGGPPAPAKREKKIAEQKIRTGAGKARGFGFAKINK